MKKRVIAVVLHIFTKTGCVWITTKNKWKQEHFLHNNDLDYSFNKIFGIVDLRYSDHVSLFLP